MSLLDPTKHMNPIRNIHMAHRAPARLAGLALAFVTLGSTHAATVNLAALDALGGSSFNTAGNWNPSGAPVAGNDYVVSIPRLRTPAATGDFTFAGSSLTIATSAGNMTFKGNSSAVITVPNLILSGGLIDHLNASDQVFTLAGNLTVTGTGSRLSATQGPIVVTAPIAGTGELTIIANLGTTFAAANTFTGNLVVNGAFTLADTGSLVFDIGANGVNNSVSGTGPATFNGTFTIDLADAGNTVGNSWTLVNVGTLTETFGAAFNVAGFTENEGIWTSASGTYQFSETTGVLTRISGDSDGDGLPDTWEYANFGAGNLTEGASGDFDLDFSTNLAEYLAGTNPANANSYPDTDGDGLGDGWELFYFNNSLAQTAAGDPDGDFNSNAVEFVAGTDPGFAGSYPDTEDGFGDGLNDGWEIHYFGSIAAGIPAADPDGDLVPNLDEFTAGTDPTDQLSSPDSDMDGLSDGWEVRYFGLPGESLATVIAKQSAADDPDGDSFTNGMEFAAKTDPTNASSYPTSVAYWRFEERTTGVVPVGDNSGGNQANTVLDSSGLGNHMMTWRDYTSPTYSTNLPFATVPLTGATNTASLAFARDGANLFITDNVYTTGGVALNSQVFSAFTIEASFNTTATNVWQVVIGKSGNPIGGQPPFSLKIRATDNKLLAGMVDGSGVAREAVSLRSITTGSWYSAAVTASATELKLWLKAAGDANYVLESTLPISGAFYNYAGVNAPWVIGLGKWNGADADPFGGNIDEVRISPKVLAPSEFLIPVTSNDSDGDGLDDTWEQANFGGLAQTASGDFDGDGTSNLVEYLLGLSPANGSSFFKGSLSGNTLTWPAAVGLGFTVQRSTTLGSWENVGTVNTTGPSGSWTDTNPPSGKVFYRVVLNTN